MNNIQLPAIKFNNSGIMFTDWPLDSALAMDVVREVLSEIDFNGPWLSQRYRYEDWCEVIAARVSVNLRYVDPIRSKYIDSVPRIYSEIDINRSVVSDIVKHMERGYGITIYHDISMRDVALKIENIPACPSCGSYLRLMWKRWGRPGGYNLIWACPVYNKSCRNTIHDLWPHMCPEIVYDRRDIPTMFYGNNLVGYPLSDEWVREPLSEWSRGDLSSTARSIVLPDLILSSNTTEIMEETTMARKRRPEFTEDMKTFLKDNYRSGDMGTFVDDFTRKYHTFRASRYDLQREAYNMGITSKDEPIR